MAFVVVVVRLFGFFCFVGVWFNDACVPVDFVEHMFKVFVFVEKSFG